MKITIKQVAYAGITLSAMGLLLAILMHDVTFMLVDSINIVLILWLMDSNKEESK